jgi:hypothetical protein
MDLQMKKLKQLKNKKFIVNDLESLQKEFYKTYNPDYWLYKISLLKNCHDNFDHAKEVLTKDLPDVVDEDYKRTLRTELHFLYFQIVETLFEIIFAVSKHDNRHLWLALTFSNDRQCGFYSDTYEQIKQLSDTSYLFTSKIKTAIAGKDIEIMLLRWIFYFVYPSKMDDDEWKNNLDKIKRLLLLFAKDFSDRGEYNAYKHSLRFYNSSFSMSIGLTGSKNMYTLGASDNSITYLEEQKKKEQDGQYKSTGHSHILQTTKPFDFERDYTCCRVIYEMIKNIINTRKHSLLPELNGKEFQFSTFVDIDIQKVAIPKTGIIKSSFTV